MTGEGLAGLRTLSGAYRASVASRIDTLVTETVPQPYVLHFRAGIAESEAGFSQPTAGLTEAQLRAANKAGVDPIYVAPNGRLLYPSNDGFATVPVSTTLGRGTLIDRFGNPNGRFLAPAGTAFEQRALPASSTIEPYYQYKVLKPLPVEAGPAAPAFGQIGGATQYRLQGNLTVQNLIDGGFIKCVKGPGC